MKAAAVIDPRLVFAASRPTHVAPVFPSAAKHGKGRALYEIRLFDAIDTGRLIATRLLGEGSLAIGRDPDADWPIDDPRRAISRRHGELVSGPEGLAIRVIGANGVTLVGSEERLETGTETLLQLPCTLELGGFRLDITALAPAAGSSAEPASGSLLEAFCQGARLDSSLLSGEEPEEIMRRAGAIYRETVMGICDLMAERDQARGQFEMRRTTIGSGGNNLFKWAPTQRLALDLLLSGPASFLSGPAAVRASFGDIRQHLVASLAGLKGALRAVVDAFSPEVLERIAPEGGSFLRGRAAAQVEELARRHGELSRQVNDGEHGTLSRAFVQAYDEADVAARELRRD